MDSGRDKNCSMNGLACGGRFANACTASCCGGGAPLNAGLDGRDDGSRLGRLVSLSSHYGIKVDVEQRDTQLHRVAQPLLVAGE
jgi:hypothetical protein